LTEEEFAELRGHVARGVEMIQGSGLMNRDVLDMVAHHHERHDLDPEFRIHLRLARRAMVGSRQLYDNSDNQVGGSVDQHWSWNTLLGRESGCWPRRDWRTHNVHVFISEVGTGGSLVLEKRQTMDSPPEFTADFWLRAFLSVPTVYHKFV